MCLEIQSVFRCVVLQVQGMVQRVVIVLRVIVGQRVAADDQLQSVSGLRDQRHGQAAVEVPRPHVVHLCREAQVTAGGSLAS